ncbi:hypothetical protein E5D57_005041 [Metarhizium anisopliae]|nr:hypothetical protein E5D57_005041 [Metarhizium anisopliae]
MNDGGSLRGLFPIRPRVDSGGRPVHVHGAYLNRGVMVTHRGFGRLNFGKEALRLFALAERQH